MSAVAHPPCAVFAWCTPFSTRQLEPGYENSHSDIFPFGLRAGYHTSRVWRIRHTACPLLRKLETCSTLLRLPKSLLSSTFTSCSRGTCLACGLRIPQKPASADSERRKTRKNPRSSQEIRVFEHSSFGISLSRCEVRVSPASSRMVLDRALPSLRQLFHEEVTPLPALHDDHT